MANSLLRLLNKTSYKLTKHSVKELEWVEQIKGLDYFFDWVKNSVTDENCISAEDLRMYNCLKQNGKLFDESELDSVLRKYMCEEDDLDHFEDDVEVYTEEIESKKNELIKLTILKEHLSSELNKLHYESSLNKGDYLLNEELKRIDMLNEEYKKELVDLERAFLVLHDALSSIENVTKHKFLCQRPLDQFLDDMDAMKTYVTSLKISFKNQKDKENNKNHIYGELRKPEFIECHLNRVFDSLMFVESESAKIKSNIASINASLNYISTSQQVDKNWFFNISDELGQNEPLLAVDEDELITICEEYLRGMFCEKQLKVAEEKIRRQKTILKQLEEFEMIVKPFKLLSECSFHLIRNEWKWIRICVSLLNDNMLCLHDALNHYGSRKAWLNRLIMKQEIIMTNTVNSTLSSTLNKLVNSTDIDDFEDSASYIRNVNSSLISQENTVFDNLLNLNTQVNNILMFLKEVNLCFCNGPTKSGIINLQLLFTLNRLKNDVRGIEVSNQNLKKKYESYMETIESDIYNKRLHTLWLDYLHNFYNVLQELLKLEEDTNSLASHQNIHLEKNLHEFLQGSMF